MRIERVDISRRTRATEGLPREDDARRTERGSPRPAIPKARAAGDSRECIEGHVHRLNETLRTFDKRLRFRIHESTERLIVRVVDAETEEVLREIPPEEVLKLAAHIEEMVGLIIDERI